MNDEQARRAEEAMTVLRKKWQAKDETIENWRRHWRTRLSQWLRDIASIIELPCPLDY